jgi:hypothetical protein
MPTFSAARSRSLDLYSPPVALPFVGPAFTPEFSSSCRLRWRNDYSPEIFLVESTGKARPTAEERSLC